jgi:hypothetical protein
MRIATLQLATVLLALTFAGKYKIEAMYSNLGQTVRFALNNEQAADCKPPVDVSKQLPLPNFPDWIVWHTWNKAACGETKFPHAGRQLLTFHYKKGNNFAYFDFVPAD